MKYLMYEIKNNINGKIYVGVHKTSNEDDGYMGSGKYLRRAIEKHGIENFTKTILERFETAQAMFEREKEYVNEEFLARKDVYNLRRGGFGGFDHIIKNRTADEFSFYAGVGGKAYASRLKEDSEFRDYISKGKKQLLDYRISNGYESPLKKFPEYSEQGRIKAKSPESRKKRVETYAEIDHQKGDKNSQFGSMWITNGTENRKIRKEEFIPEGWRKGRKLKRIM